MRYILLMTSAGSVLFAGEMLLAKLMGKHMSPNVRYRMLVAVMFTYLVPWVWLKGVYGDIKIPLPAVKSEAIAASGGQVMDDAAIHTGSGLLVTRGYSSMLQTVAVWMGIALLIVLVRSGIYFFNRHALLKCARSLEQDIPEELVRRLKKEFGIRRSVEVIRVSDKKRSLTMGIVKPVVFVQKGGSEDELEKILRHEFTHIARGDLLIKALMQLTCCMHWFNPFAYWLSRSLDRACEKSCDERVVRDMPEDERSVYAGLMVNSMRGTGTGRGRNALFGRFFVSNEQFAEERIKAIMVNEKKKLWEKVVVAGIFAVMLFADSLTAMAYPQVYNVHAPEEVAERSVQGTVTLVCGGDEYAQNDAETPVISDAQVITADGEVHPLQGQARVLCFHKWQDAKYQIHTKNSNGGCTIEVYACTYCSKCDTVNVGDLVSTTTYTVCNHNYD